MYWSKYNRIYNIDNGRYAIYNYAWDKTIFIVKELADIVLNNLNNIDALSSIHPTFYNALLSNGMIVETLFDEIEKVKHNIIKSLSSDKVLRLTINPTLDCNLRCWYCYEKHNNEAYMSERTIKSIESFIALQLRNKNLKKIRLGFFGGEPLLTANKRAIPIAKTIAEMCRIGNVALSLHFTTNGSLLRPNLIDSISELNIPTSFQIAFDGNKIFHNKTKNWNGIGTYNIVLENINYALSKHLKINIRFNYTSDNISSFKGLIDDIVKLQRTNKTLIEISLQRIWQEKQTKKLFEKVQQINDYAISKGIKCAFEDSACAKSYCYADYDYSYVINYNGDIFKCTARDFNSSNKIGIIDDKGNIVLFDSSSKSEMRIKSYCAECSLLPICTICSQKHRENNTNKCPNIISEEDKENQIKMRFNELFAN